MLKRKTRIAAAALGAAVCFTFPMGALAGDAGSARTVAQQTETVAADSAAVQSAAAQKKAAAQNAAKTSEAEPTLPQEVRAEIVGETTYYFCFNESDERITGWQTLSNGKTYYFAPNSENEELNGAMQTGWLTLNGSKYYLSENPATLGQLQTGWQTIKDENGSHRYYFAAEGTAGEELGAMQTGVKKINGKLYYFGTDGRVTTAKSKWIDNNKYYAIGGGQIAAGAKKIGKTWYYFSKSTGRRAGKGFVKVNGKSLYYCKGAGKLKTGWMAKGNYGYYFSKKTAKRAYNTSVGYIKVDKKGRVGKAYAEGIRVLNKKGWTLRAAFRYASHLRYANHDMRRKSSAAYAHYGFRHHKGNCYVMAGTFYILAQLQGCRVRQAYGSVVIPYPHSWTVVRQNGRWYVYDPNFTNETGRNGFKFRYGKRGTWRYHLRGYMN
ncbi:MAG: transglutaminase domain-containing protein [Anaerovoracaceae bacterium]|jgi:glucan-binding YG repeat protein